MPELPEVETVVRTLRPLLAGQPALRVHLLRADILTPPGMDLAAALTGQAVRVIDRRGKKILIRLESGPTLFIHLGMTGRLTVDPPDTPLPPHTHLLVDFACGQLRFRDPRRFGGVWWLTDADSADDNLGPEPLTLRPAQLAKLLSRTRRPIKCALLDQSLIAGLGNIYADEALFAARIHPLTPANQLRPEQIGLLNRSIKRILNRAIASRGSSLRDYVDANGQPGGFQKLHRVYNRADRPCATCRTPIARIILGGRSTHFCPKCQA